MLEMLNMVAQLLPGDIGVVGGVGVILSASPSSAQPRLVSPDLLLLSDEVD